MSEAIWYYARKDEPEGPLSFEELVEVLKRDAASPDVLVWTEGWSDWTRAGEVPVLNLRLVRPPPLPSKRPASPSPLSPEYRREPAPLGQKGWKGAAAGILGSVIGLGLSKAMGSSFWMPALCIMLSWLGLTRIKIIPAPSIAMLSVLLGHTLWIGIGQFTLALLGKPDSDGHLFLIDVAATAGIVAWCLKRPSVTSAVAVLVYQSICTAWTVMDLDNISRINELAAFVHLFLRLLGIGLAVFAVVKLRKAHSPSDVKTTKALRRIE